MRKVFDKLDPEDAVAIQKCHSLLNDSSIEAHLVGIHSIKLWVFISQYNSS